MPSNPDLQTPEQRLRRLEDREAIRELIARYGFAVDDRDIAAIAACFARDGAFRSIDGELNAQGRDAVIAQFHGRFAVLGPSNHFTHDAIFEFDDGNPDRATGLVNSHAEVVRNGQAMWASMRYRDEYVREQGHWRFRDRLLAFFYYLSPGDYARLLEQPMRNRAYAEPRPADVPEQTATWRSYYAQHPRR
jgi:ketosteroid isomerase-like protein